VGNSSNSDIGGYLNIIGQPVRYGYKIRLYLHGKNKAISDLFMGHSKGKGSLV
jgi:hypothetical protein